MTAWQRTELAEDLAFRAAALLAETGGDTPRQAWKAWRIVAEDWLLESGEVVEKPPHHQPKPTMRIITLFCLIIPFAAPAADITLDPLAQKGAPLLSDDFERASLGEWKSLIPTFTVTNGILKGVQTRADHGAVNRVYRPMQDVVVEFRFKLDGSPTFNAVFDDQAHKGSHAGHIARVAFTPKQITLGDDKEGAMRNDIFEMRKDPARKADGDKLLAGRSSSAPVTLNPEKWHQVTIEIAGDRMRVTLDGKPAGLLQSPGLAHPTKTSFHFTVNGPGVLFDDVRIWKAR